jgi:hypothetical protein
MEKVLDDSLGSISVIDDSVATGEIEIYSSINGNVNAPIA